MISLIPDCNFRWCCVSSPLDHLKKKKKELKQLLALIINSLETASPPIPFPTAKWPQFPGQFGLPTRNKAPDDFEKCKLIKQILLALIINSSDLPFLTIKTLPRAKWQRFSGQESGLPARNKAADNWRQLLPPTEELTVKGT